MSLLPSLPPPQHLRSPIPFEGTWVSCHPRDTRRARRCVSSAPARARSRQLWPSSCRSGPPSQTDERLLISTNLGRGVCSLAASARWAGTTKAGGEGRAGSPGTSAVPPQSCSGGGGGGGGGWRAPGLRRSEPLIAAAGSLPGFVLRTRTEAKA